MGSSSAVLLLAMCLSLLYLSSPVDSLSVSELPSAISDIISLPEYARMEWGILVEAKLPNGTYAEIYSMNADQFFTPASNNKVITTAPAYLYFGNDFRMTTPVYTSDSPVSGSVPSLCLEGRGDPTIADADMRQVSESVYESGVNATDMLVVDNSFFPGFPGSWEWEDLVADYGAQPSSVVLNQNAFTVTVAAGEAEGDSLSISFASEADARCVQVENYGTTTSGTPEKELVVGIRIGSSAVSVVGQMQVGSASVSSTFAVLQPAERFACALAYRLEEAGVSVGAYQVADCDGGPNGQLVGSIISDTLVPIMNYTLQESDNLFAESYLRQLGAQFDPQGDGEAQSKGVAAVRTILEQNGVDTSTFKQVDGSGLSRHDLVSPRAMVEVLEMMDGTPNAATYRSFLPVAGESGTLSNRFIDTPAQGVVEAKTGSMSGVNTISGYVDESDTFPQIVFSILTNFSQQSSSTVRKGIDSIVVYFSILEEE